MGPVPDNLEKPLAPDSSPGDGEVLSRKLGILYGNLPGALAVNVVVSAVVAFVVYEPRFRMFLGGWVCAAALLGATRAADLVVFRRRPESGPTAPGATRFRYHIAAGLQGVLWGILTYTLIPHVPPVQQLFLLLLVSGMAAGGVSYLAPIPSSYFIFLIPTLVPACVRFLQSPEFVQRSAGALGIVYTLAMAFAAARIGRWIDDSVRTAIGNEALIAKQQETNAELTRHQDHLESVVAERTAELTAANEQLLSEVEEKELRRRETEQIHTRFRELTDMLPEIVFELDAEGSITYVNRKFFELTGNTPEGLPSPCPATRLVTQGEAHRFQEMVREVLAGTPRVPAEFAACREDGSSFPVMMVCAPVERDGCVHGVRGLAIDMTQQREMATRIREAAKMEALGTLAGGVAHDFNNILAVILAQAEVATRQSWGTPGLDVPLNRIVVAADRAKHLVNQILTFARSHDEEPVPLDVGAVTSVALDLVAASLPPDITLRRDVAEASATVLGDPTRIQQVVLNLCANAGQAMAGDGGTLTVALKTRAFRGGESAPEHLPPGRYAELRVSDTGPGIPDEVKARMFEPFYTTKAVGEGTGMGLAVVHGVVTAAGGTIQLDTAEEKGATFRVYLPLADAAPAADELGSEDAGTRGTERILVVDDDEAVWEAVAGSLEIFGYETRGVSCGSEALELLATEEFAAIITDYSMPVMSGTELAREVYKRSGADSPPVIVYTGDTNAIPAGSLRDGSVTGVLQKPVRPPELARAIRQALAPDSAEAETFS